MDKNLIVSYAPHTRTKENTRTVMLDVIIALMPALIVGTYYFGFRAAFITLISAASCMAFETIWNMIIKKENTAGDLSSAVTGILLAFCLPPQIPVWMVIIGDAFAIIVVKCFFGGIGQNIVNPALCARAFMMASWPVEMTYFTMGTDATSGATALALYKNGTGSFPPFFDLFLGNQLGCIGEGAALFLLIGGIYLVARKVITATIPLTYILTVGICGFIFSPHGFFHGDFLFSIVTGGVMLGGIFMATDYTTSPVTKKGQFIYALLAGFITVIIRTYGSYPEGVTYAILLANIATPLIDKFVIPKKFGYVKEGK